MATAVVVCINRRQPILPCSPHASTCVSVPDHWICYYSMAKLSLEWFAESVKLLWFVFSIFVDAARRSVNTGMVEARRVLMSSSGYDVTNERQL